VHPVAPPGSVQWPTVIPDTAVMARRISGAGIGREV